MLRGFYRGFTKGLSDGWEWFWRGWCFTAGAVCLIAFFLACVGGLNKLKDEYVPKKIYKMEMRNV